MYEYDAWSFRGFPKGLLKYLLLQEWLAELDLYLLIGQSTSQGVKNRGFIVHLHEGLMTHNFVAIEFQFFMNYAIAVSGTCKWIIVLKQFVKTVDERMRAYS